MKDIIGLAVLAWPLTLLVFVWLLFFLVMALAVRYAIRTGRNKWLWGIAAFLLVYLPIFWDWIPTVVAHRYYCEKEAGFWIYKTLDQWKAENPGVLEGLVANKVWPHQQLNGKDMAIINSRFRLVYDERKELFLHRWPDIRELVDAKNHEVIARYVDFSTSQERQQAGWSGWKFWLARSNCPSGDIWVQQFGKFYLQFRGDLK